MFPKEEFRKLLILYFLITFFLSSLLGASGKYAYGNETAEFIFSNLKKHGLFKGVATDYITAIYSLTLLFNIVIYAKPVIE